MQPVSCRGEGIATLSVVVPAFSQDRAGDLVEDLLSHLHQGVPGVESRHRGLADVGDDEC